MSDIQQYVKRLYSSSVDPDYAWQPDISSYGNYLRGSPGSVYGEQTQDKPPTSPVTINLPSAKSSTDDYNVYDRLRQLEEMSYGGGRYA